MTDADKIEALQIKLHDALKNRDLFWARSEADCARVETAEAKLAARDAEVKRLQEALKIARASIEEDIELVGYDADELLDHPAIIAIDAALAPLPKKAPNDDDLQSAECVRYQQARELD